MLTAKVEAWIALSAWKWVQTTIYPSPSTHANCWPAFTPCCAAAPRRKRQRPRQEAQTVQFGPFEFDLALRRLSKEGEPVR